MTLDAKATANVESHTSYLRFRQTENRRGLPPHPMHDLGRGPDCRGIGSRVVGGGDTPALDRHCGITVMIESALQPVRRAGQCFVDIALRDRERAEELGVQLLVDDR